MNPEDLEKNWGTLAERAKYTVAGLAKVCGWSVRQLQRNFRMIMRDRPKRALKALRLNAARTLLEDGVTVKAAAYSLGYARPEHLSRDFRKFYGLSPSELHKQC